MQCKKCGDDLLDISVHTIQDHEMNMVFIETVFKCETCKSSHTSRINWRDYYCKNLSDTEFALA